MIHKHHLRRGLAMIQAIATTSTPGGPVDDLAVIANLADQALRGTPLIGDPKVYELPASVRSLATPGGTP